jgi:curli biogenesis system outer membrane secretion channel CsgG
MGAMAVVEPQSEILTALMRYKLQSPVGLIRMMIQQSNCFIVVERGQGMRNMMQERQLASGGEMRQGANLGGGQMVAADFILTPGVVFSENNAGGIGGAAGGLLGGKFAAVAGGLKFKEAQTSMLVADARSSIQVAAAEGSARKADFRLGGLFAGGGVAAGLGGYENTNEGKVIAASFADNYNGIVRAVRGNPGLQRQVASLAGAETGAQTKAGSVFSEGDVLRPKIANVKLLAKPSEESALVVMLTKGEELIFMGKEQDGFLNVETSKGAGWVKKVLVTR